MIRLLSQLTLLWGNSMTKPGLIRQARRPRPFIKEVRTLQAQSKGSNLFECELGGLRVVQIADQAPTSLPHDEGRAGDRRLQGASCSGDAHPGTFRICSGSVVNLVGQSLPSAIQAYAAVGSEPNGIDSSSMLATGTPLAEISMSVLRTLLLTDLVKSHGRPGVAWRRMHVENRPTPCERTYELRIMRTGQGQATFGYSAKTYDSACRSAEGGSLTLPPWTGAAMDPTTSSKEV